MTLRSAFFKGVISYPLWQKWISFNTPERIGDEVEAKMPSLGARKLLILLAVLLLGALWAVGAHELNRQSLGVRLFLMFIMALVTFLGIEYTTAAFTCWLSEWKFLRDIKRLSRLFDLSKSLPFSELREQAEGILRGKAADLESSESLNRFGKTTDEARKDFCQTHQLLKIFGLASLDRGSYFQPKESLVR